MMQSEDAWAFIRKELEFYHFGGYLDTRKIPQYDKFLLDGIPMSSLRAGTWFCFGNTTHYLENDYTMGDYRTYPRWYLNLKYRTTRIKVQRYKIWLNGGFDLNIRARLNGDRIYIVDKDAPYAQHWQKITGFFANRNLVHFADTEVEVQQWQNYLEELKRKDEEQFEFDINFLSQLAEKIASLGVHDDLLNPDQINCFRNL